VNTSAQPVFSNAYLKESEAILLNKGKTFYWARFFLSPISAQRATRLYRFCRFIDDLADEAQDKTAVKEALISIKSELETGISEHVVITDAIQLFKECDIPIHIPCELINGVMSDLSHVRVRSEAELFTYCYRVAGTVGIMMCKVLNVSNPSALFHAIDLGIAMQLTNICRDVHEDAGMDRIYLPESLTGDVSPQQVFNDNKLKRDILIQSVGTLLNKADDYYGSAYLGLAHLPFRSRVSILVAAKLYQAIGHQIQQSPIQALSMKVYVPKRLKLLLSITVCMKALVDYRFWFYRSAHQSKLHQLIAKLPFCNG
jgi:phytoene synthase